MTKKKPVPISRSVAHMEGVVARSHDLWRSVNAIILRILKKRISRQGMIDQLMKFAGSPRPRRGEMSSLMNVRTAARQLRRGELVSVM